VLPGQFIPILEETRIDSRGGPLGAEAGSADFLRWRAAGLPAVRIAVNVSPLQLRSHSFVADIRKLVDSDAHAASGIELEITEGMIMADVKHSIATLQAIREMGVSIAIDDFGTGFSSLGYLSKLPIDTLKDRPLVRSEMTLRKGAGAGVDDHHPGPFTETEVVAEAWKQKSSRGCSDCCVVTKCRDFCSPGRYPARRSRPDSFCGDPDTEQTVGCGRRAVASLAHAVPRDGQCSSVQDFVQALVVQRASHPASLSRNSRIGALMLCASKASVNARARTP
jgi:hypothetical protein